MAQRLKNLRRTHHERLSQYPNVVGTMVSTKRVHGEDTGKSCITILVKKKIPRDLLRPEHICPEKVDDVPTDVVEVGDVRKQRAKTDRLRPAPRGSSIGHYEITAGTLGCIVYRDSQSYILSNNHVLANENRASVGDPILQPGSYDGGRNPEDIIGRLADFVPIDFGTRLSACPVARAWVDIGNTLSRLLGRRSRFLPPVVERVPNLVDAAIAKPEDPGQVSNEVFEGGRQPAQPLEAEVGLEVFKTGRTSCLTTNRIIGVDATLQVGYDSGQATFEGQILAGSMSKPGDSGSLVQQVDTNRTVGLLFAGSDLVTIINPIQAVLDQLRVRL